MSLDPGLHRRRSIRIQGYDYTSPGQYYVTVCVKDRECLFGSVRHGAMQLNEFGRIVQQTWNEIPDHYPSVVLDAFVVMPNHVHAIIGITDWGHSVGAQHAAPLQSFTVKPGSLGAIIRSLKSATTRLINIQRGTPGKPVWQRNYYERIIRDDRELDRIRNYIANNPAQWKMGSMIPGKISSRA